jgi:PAS domain-containing protein
LDQLLQEYGIETCRATFQQKLLDFQDTKETKTEQQQQQQQQQSPQTEEQINQAILEVSFDGFLLVDKEGWIVNCNAAAKHIFGYDEDDNEKDRSSSSSSSSLIGQHIMTLVGGVDPQSHKRHFTNPPDPIPGTRILTHMRDVPAIHKSGKQFRVTIGLCYIDNNNNKNGGRHYVAFIRDLTPQKRQDTLHQATFDASFDPIVVTNAQGIIQTVNHALLEEFGYLHKSSTNNNKRNKKNKNNRSTVQSSLSSSSSST